MIRTSELQHTCDDIIMTSAAHYSQSQRETTLKIVDMLREDFAQWFHRWHDILQPSGGDAEATSLGRGDSRIERDSAAAAASVYAVFCNRMHAALGGPHALALEKDSQKLLESFSPAIPSEGATPRFNAAMSEVICFAFQSTTEHWQSHAQKGTGEPIQPHLWRSWLALCGMFPTTNE